MRQQKQHLITSSPQLNNWQDLTIDKIIGGKFPDGSLFLTQFLRDYTAIFSEKVNPSCSKCLNSYLQKYKQKLFDMENTCDYKLKLKYNGISLKFGSNIMVHNGNLTNEYALELLNRYDKGQIFDKYPNEVEKTEIVEEITELLEETEIKEVKTRKKRK